MKKKTNQVVAAINVGSDLLRMSIAQLTPDSTFLILEDTSFPNFQEVMGIKIKPERIKRT